MRLVLGDSIFALKTLPESSVDMIMTSPPYWSLRDYGVDGQIGQERNWGEYVGKLAEVFHGVKRVLKDTGSMYVNLGDTYAGLRTSSRGQPASEAVKRKCLIGLPWRVALRLIEDGWILRNDIIWHKTNGLPSSVKDRLSNRYEHLFHFVKGERYYYNLEAIREPYKASSIKRFGGLLAQGFTKQDSKYRLRAIPAGVQFSSGETPVPLWLREIAGKDTDRKRSLKKVQQLYRATGGKIGHGHYAGGEYRGIRSSPFGKNPGDIWSISSSSYRGAHFAVYPEKLCVRPILSSCPALVCTKCGAPKREVVTKLLVEGVSFNVRVRDAQSGKLAAKWGDRVTASEHEVSEYDDKSYQPSPRGRVIAVGCACNSGYQPGVVLDPFVGSGTTMKVALELGRSTIGIELNPAYTQLIRERIPQLQTQDICQAAPGREPEPAKIRVGSWTSG